MGIEKRGVLEVRACGAVVDEEAPGVSVCGGMIGVVMVVKGLRVFRGLSRSWGGLRRRGVLSCEEEPAWNKSEGCGSSGGVMEETSMSSVAVLAS